MNDLDLESYKFKAESLKQFGFVLCTPLCLLILDIIMRKLNLINFLFNLETYVALTLFLLGFTMINRSLDILKKERWIND